ncbi:MAG: Gldg family protein [Gammaproteobacteria bacterium]|nr:Gldg family protein [Gammaproteobacteria bacterium]
MSTGDSSGGRMNARLLTGAGLALAVVALFAVNIFTTRVFSSARLDLTENQLFTLSAGTRETLAGLEEPITLRLYLSERIVTRIPAVNSYATRVKGLLEEYSREAGGKIRVHIIDPEPFSPEEDRAVAYGLRGVPVEGGEETLYFGLVGTSSTDDEEVIPFLTTSREQFLEYDITRMVDQLAHPERTVIGLLSTLPIDGMGPQAALRGVSAPPWMVMDQISQEFEVERIETDARTIPEQVGVLMLVHPKGLSDELLYAIDQFVLRGGRLLVFVDPHSDADQSGMIPGMPMMPSSRDSNLPRLFSSWGIDMDSSKVVGDLQLAAKVRIPRGTRMLTVDYPVWLNIVPQYMDDEDAVTGDLGNVTLATPGSLTAVEGAATRFIPLIRTTDAATRYDAQRLLDPTADPEALLRDYRPEQSYVLAARVTGKVASAFPDGPPPAPQSEQGAGAEGGGAAKPAEPVERAPHLAESAEDVNLIVVADTDFLQDRFWVQVQDFLGTRIAIPDAANGSFVVNALDNLSGSNALISVRNRGSFTRPFDRVNAMRQAAEVQFREKERELMQRLEQTEQRLLELEQAKQGDDALILSPEQREELVRFRQEKLAIRKDLREVRRALRQDIEELESWLKFANIGLIPLLIGAGGLAAGLWQARRRRVAVARHAG